MSSRKPLQVKDQNKRAHMVSQLSNTSTLHLSQHKDAVRRFQLPSYDTGNTSIKIKQSVTRTSRLSHQATKPRSEKVISAKSWWKKKRNGNENQPEPQYEDELDLPLQPSPMEKQEHEQQYLYFPKQQTQIQRRERIRPLNGIGTESLESQQQPIHRDQLDKLLFTSANERNMDQTPTSVKRQHQEFDQQSPLDTDNQQDLLLTIPFNFSSPTSTTSPSPKRHHGLDLISPTSIGTSTQTQQKMESSISTFDMYTWSWGSALSSPTSTYRHDTELYHLQALSDSDDQQQSLRPLTQFQLFDQSSSNSPISSPNSTHEELELSQHTYEDTEPSNSPPHISDTPSTDQVATSNSREMVLQSKLQPSLEPAQVDQRPLSSVYNLNDDCLAEILKWCATTNTLCEVSLVCKHWRNVALQPFTWRTIDYTWGTFVQQLKQVSSFNEARKTKSKNNNQHCDLHLSSPLTHIRTITLDNTKNSTLPLLGTPTGTSIFANLRTLRLTTMYFKDILDLIPWTKNLVELDCKSVLYLNSNDKVMITPFSELRHLQILKLHFESMCELVGPTSLSGIIGDRRANQATSNRWHLPPNLRVLKINNIYDIEEYLAASNSISNGQQQPANMTMERMEAWVKSWNAMESTLMHKYRVLTALKHLTSLSLGYCTAYTARIWRECVAPAAKSLKRLSLCGWNGNGNQEGPSAWKERHDTALKENTSVDLYMEDVEMALAEMLGSLHCLESLALIEFKCSTGVIEGMEQLTKTTGNSLVCMSLQAVMDNNDDSSPVRTIDTPEMTCASSLKELLGWHLVQCKFKLFRQA